MKDHRRAAARRTDNLEIAPRQPILAGDAHRLHRRFLRCEPGCEGLERMGLSLTVLDFFFGVNPLNEPIAGSPQGASEIRKVY
jgi:hypothetical protein